MTNMTDPYVLDKPQLMLVPGGTTPGAVTMTYAAVHKLWEFWERFETTGHKRKSRIIVAPRPMHECVPPNAERSNAALQGRLDHLPDNVDVILETSGSTTGEPHLVGMSFAAMVASARATHEVLGGPGRWIVALPVHHVAGLHTLVRSCVAEASPIIADMSTGFDANSLIRACRSAADDADSRTYLSLVPKQLADALDHGGELVELLGKLDAILVGGSGISGRLLGRAREAGLPIVTTYGMTETSGGCVYDGRPLPGVDIRVRDGQIEIAGPVLMEDYLDVKSTDWIFDADGKRWLRTSDAGEIVDGVLTVHGRADDVIVSGGVNIAPGRVRESLLGLEGVADADVVALDDDTWGQVVAAAVVVDQSASADAQSSDLSSFSMFAQPIPAAPSNEEFDLDAFAEKVRDHVGNELGRDHAPRVIGIVDELPTTDLGKVDRAGVVAKLRDLVESGQAWVR